MASTRMTRRMVADLQAPDPSGKQVIFWDGELKGFGVLVSGKTTAKCLTTNRNGCVRSMPLSS